jgi:glycine/D-amino acid oxidase-like deaminating enzyme
MRTDSVFAETDVLVIGAGIYGCATAYFLSRLGVDVMVVDAGDIGAGASGANAGNLHLQLSPFSNANKSPEWIVEFARTLPFFVEALALWKRLGDELDCDIERRCPGGIMVAETDHQMQILREKGALERAHGLPIEMCGGADLRQLAPYIASPVLGASYCPDEGMANALLAVTGLADGARSAGARFVLNAQVERMEQHAADWRVDTLRGRIHCRRVVIAAGSSAGDVAAMAGVQLPLTHRIIQMVATEACEPFIEHLVYHAESRLTLKQVANGNVLIGGGWTAQLDPVFGRPAVLSESLRGSLAVARTVVPRLAEVSVIRSWAGPNIYTPDGRPILGAVPGHPGLFTAVCNTYGFTLGPLCGLLVAELITERPLSFDASPFAPSRFTIPSS